MSRSTARSQANPDYGPALERDRKVYCEALASMKFEDGTTAKRVASASRRHRRQSMKLRAILAFVACIASLSTSVRPVYGKVDVEDLGWFQISATGPIGGNWKLSLEVAPRVGTDPANGDTNLRTVNVRGAMGYQITEPWSLWAGYGYHPTFNPSRDENRAFQQSTFVTKAGPFKMSNRTRIEERFIEDVGQPALRLRHQLWLGYPLPRWPAWSLVAAEEPFVNLNTVHDGPHAGFDQNRIYLGVSREVGPHVRVEVDYLNQFVRRHSAADDLVRNGGILQLAFAW